MQQFLRSLDQHPSAPTQLLTTLQLELSNIQDIYKYSKTTITSAIKLLNSNQLQTRAQCRRSLLPFLGDALSWLTGTATTKDIHSIKTRINQLIAMQTSQCNTLVHIVSILNVTRYATQVNRHSINNLIDAVCTTSQDINNLYNLTTSLAASINFNQMILHIHDWYLLTFEILFTTFKQFLHILWNTLMLPPLVYCHHMSYQSQIYRRCSNTLLTPYHQPCTYQYHQKTPYISTDTCHTHILIENKQFLLLIDIPIQDRACQITVHQVFTLDIPHGNYSACYDINTRYLG